jgi:hypothetical protein
VRIPKTAVSSSSSRRRRRRRRRRRKKKKKSFCYNAFSAACIMSNRWMV